MEPVNEEGEKKSRGVKNPVLNLIIMLVESGALEAMSGGTRKVLDVLIAHRNPKSRTCWPSTKTIEREAGVGRRQIFRSLSWLIACGIIERKKGPSEINFVNVYKVILNPIINIPPGLEKRPRKRLKGCQKSTTEVDKRKSQKSAQSDTEVTPLLCSSKVAHLLGDKTAPQKDLKYREVYKEKQKTSPNENKERKISDIVDLLAKNMSGSCGEKEFKKLKKGLQKASK